MTIQNAIKETAETLITQPPTEGKWTKRIESQTSKIPSVAFLNLALGSVAFSAIYKMINPKSNFANFVGLWVPTFLLLGIYNKLVKLEGHDRYDHS